MIVRTLWGSHFYTPIGKIKLVWLQELLMHIINQHPLSEPSWMSVITNNSRMCIDFLTEYLEITSGPICEQLQQYLHTVMACLNRENALKIIHDNEQLFQSILDNLQTNENNATFSKCTVFKLPSSCPFIIKSKRTKYYLFIEIARLAEASKYMFDLSNPEKNNSKL